MDRRNHSRAVRLSPNNRVVLRDVIHIHPKDRHGRPVTSGSKAREAVVWDCDPPRKGKAEARESGMLRLPRDER